jgi:uncharacterized protein (DUF433 family)/DNA-binding transcriptional MerR regulator
MPSADGPKLVGRGLYDIAEVSRLVGVTIETLSRWAAGTSTRPAVVEPQLDPFFSFHDLLTVQLVRELRRRGVTLKHVATGIGYLREVTGVDRPFAHRDMATSGRSWFSEIGEQQVDVGRGGQLAWDQVVAPTLRALTYSDAGMAAIWRPAPRIWLNPNVQAGASCIDNSRTTTHLIWDLVGAGADVHDIVWQFELDLDDVLAARDFERSLEERRPLQLVGS